MCSGVLLFQSAVRVAAEYLGILGLGRPQGHHDSSPLLQDVKDDILK